MEGRSGPTSTAQSASIRVSEQEGEEGAFGPASVVIFCGREEGAVTSALGFDVGDTGIFDERVARGGKHADEGIVERMQDKHWGAELACIFGAGDAVVVVVGAGEASVARDDVLVEETHAADLFEGGGAVDLRKQRGLTADACQHG